MLGRSREEPSPQSLVSGATITTSVAPAELADRSGPSEGPLLLLFVILTLAASAYVLWRSEHDALHDPKEKAARGEIKGLDRLSLLRAENLRQALAKIDGGPHPLVWNIRVAADRVNAGVRDADGNRKILAVDLVPAARPGTGARAPAGGRGRRQRPAAARRAVGRPEARESPAAAGAGARAQARRAPLPAPHRLPPEGARRRGGQQVPREVPAVVASGRRVP